MPLTVSVIIASLDEERLVGEAVHSSFVAGATEVIVADGGSADDTRWAAAREGARVITTERGRARQFNEGAAAATGDILLFLHADTALPADALSAVRAAVDRGASFGGFRIAFFERSWKLRFVAAMINLRTSITKCPWGDQAQFIRRTVFIADGGFRDMPLMEDYELAVRMKRRGRNVLLPSRVKTSGRRFIRHGLIRTSWINWKIVLLYRLGVSVEKLAAMYRA